MPVYKLFGSAFLGICFSISVAQTKTTGRETGENANISRGFVQFNSDGTTFGMNPAKENEIKLTAELKYSGTTPQLLLALYTNTLSRDTILLYLYDDKGLTAGTGGFSQNAKLLFIYKLFGKGSMIKTLDNTKGEITAANYIRLTKLDARAGGIVEGVFNFTGVPFQSRAGKVVAKVKELKGGLFKTQITEYNEIKGKNTVPGSATGQLSAIANLLFKDVKCKLTDTEKNQVADLTGFVLSGKAGEPFAANKESLEYPYSAQVTITDMNKDGIEEVFIQYGNTFTSGNTGANIALFIKNKQGAYKLNLGFPGIDPEQLKTGFGGYPDLLIGGPGFEFPIWRWNGKEYVFYKTQKQKP
jgi:hypothetical protein